MSEVHAPDRAERQCGRCRRFFEADHDGPAAALQDWWVCATCRLSILPTKAARTPAPVPGVPPVTEVGG